MVRKVAEMYDEGAEEQPYVPAGGFKGKIKYHFEGLIPLILIVLVIVLAGGYLGLWDIPYITKAGPAKMLIIGRPSQLTFDALNSSKDLVHYQVRDDEYFGIDPEYMLSHYDIVMLDQTNSSHRPMLSRQTAEAIEKYVRKGGKLIIVGNSGIMRRDAPEVVGWRALLGDIAPVDCILDIQNIPTCLQPIRVRGQLLTIDYEHPIVEGIERVPPLQEDAYDFEVFNVATKGNEIAYIQEGTQSDVYHAKWYPGIVERRHILGKVIYFNYDPGITPAILQKTIKYLR